MSKPPSELNDPKIEYTPDATTSEGTCAHPSRDGYKDNTPECDLSQLERNVSLTPEERLIEHQHALELVLALEAAGRSLRAKTTI